MAESVPPLQTAGRPVDIVLCFDATGSMGPIIGKVKENAKEIVKRIYEGCEKAGKKIKEKGLRVKVIQFRDLPINEPMVASDWIVDPEEFVTTVDGIEPQGGGSEPESSLDAFVEACRVDWQSLGPGGRGRRIVVLLTDASPHPLFSTTKRGSISDDIDIIKAAIDSANDEGLQGVQPFRGLIIAPPHPKYREIEKLPNMKFSPTSPGAGLAETEIDGDSESSIIPWIVNSI